MASEIFNKTIAALTKSKQKQIILVQKHQLTLDTILCCLNSIFSLQIIPEEEFAFNTDVRIGWTLEATPEKDRSWVPISFQFQHLSKLYFLNLDTLNTSNPEIGIDYEFGKLPYPAIFSVSITVAKGKKFLSTNMNLEQSISDTKYPCAIC